eukprot:Pgem_evm1s14128
MVKSGNQSEVCMVTGKHVNFFVVVHKDMAPKWRKDKSIALSEVVESFQVFCYRGDVKGEPQKPDKGELGIDCFSQCC